MFELLTPDEMARADGLAIEGGTAGIELMERAGLAVAEEIFTRFPTGSRIGVLCGPGNNGGDGFVAARVLVQRGFMVRVGLLGAQDDLAGDAKLAMQRCPVPIEPWSPGLVVWSQSVIDAVFGAGLSRPVSGEGAELIAAVKAGAAEIVSVDLPSGVSGRDGAVKGIAVRATRTVTFFRKKPGHCLMPGKQLCGEIRVADIGIRREVLDRIRPETFENAPALWRQHWRPPRPEGHKFSRGHCVAVSGPAHATGATRLAARAALRCGAGLVTIASPREALAVNAANSTAVMTTAFDDARGLSDLLADERIGSILIGPGLGLSDDRQDLVDAVLATEAFAVLDADALTLAADTPATLFRKIAARPPGRTVLTPHEGEFARLFADVNRSPAASKLDRARAAARVSGAIVLLKGADTVIASPEGKAIVNHSGSPWLATAGSGDVLAGLLAGLGAQRIPALSAAAMAVHMHCLAAVRAGPGLIAEDLVEAIKPVIAEFDREHASAMKEGGTPGHGQAIESSDQNG